MGLRSVITISFLVPSIEEFADNARFGKNMKQSAALPSIFIVRAMQLLFLISITSLQILYILAIIMFIILTAKERIAPDGVSSNSQLDFEQEDNL